MRNQIINRIREDIRSETPDINLKIILNQARIEEATPEPRRRVFFRFWPALISLALVLLVVILLPKQMDSENPQGEPAENDQYILPALSLITLLDPGEIIIENTDAISLAIGRDVDFLNRFLNYSTFLLTDNLILNNYIISYSAPDFHDSTGSKTESYFVEYLNPARTSIKLKRGNQEYLLESIQTESVIRMEMTEDNLRYQLTYNTETEVSRIKIYEGLQLLYDAKIEVNGAEVILKNMLYRNAIVSYYISIGAQGFPSISYQVLGISLDTESEAILDHPKLANEGAIQITPSGFTVITEQGELHYRVE